MKNQSYLVSIVAVLLFIMVARFFLAVLSKETISSISTAQESRRQTLAKNIQQLSIEPRLQPNFADQNLSRLPTTPQHFFLPGTQPGTLNSSIPNPAGCNTCHTAAIYDKWRGSMMGNAGRDPLFWAAVAVANQDAANSGEFCIRCHTPAGWFAGRSHPTDGSGLTQTDLSAGVACEACHRMVDPVPATSDSDQAKEIDAAIRSALTSTVSADSIGSGMLILDPNDNRRGPFKLANAPHIALQSDFFRQTNDALTRSRLCGTCHTISNPALVWTENPPNGAPAQFWPKSNESTSVEETSGLPFPIESTYDEWLNSTYAKTGVYAPEFSGAKADGLVAACQDCHMPRTTGKAADVGNAIERDCQTNGCLPDHGFVGSNTWSPLLLQNPQWRLSSAEDATLLDQAVVNAQQMLRKAATLTATLTLSGTQRIVKVRIVNQTGHKLPTGYAEGRRIWLNLKAYNAKGELVYESGKYNAATGELTRDKDIKIYEVEQGMTAELAELVGLTAGASFHFVLNNTIVKDNRIPPRGYTTSAFDKPGLRPIGAFYQDGQYWADLQFIVPPTSRAILATLYYQTASKEYIDFLRAEGGTDGQSLGNLWDTSKSPPEIMATALSPQLNTFLPLIQKQ